MIPAKIEDVFIEIATNSFGVIKNINAGKFAKKEFILEESIYNTCPFLEGMLDFLPNKEPFLLEGMVLTSEGEEYNVDAELFKNKASVIILIHNRTNVYKVVNQLNQDRNNIFFLKRELAEKTIELEKQRKIAEKANEEKSRFLAMMSHEVRNPLNVILGYSEMISKEEINKNVQEYSKLLSISGKHLKIIVDDILDLSRIEAGKLELVNSEINVKQLAENCIINFKHQNKKEDVQLVLKLSKIIPNIVLGDDARIHQILSNLLSNAIKFTQKGEISLTINLISEDKNTIKLSFEIKDSGRGMTKEQAAKIFNEYHQNKKSDNRVFGGAGLGLSIVKRLLTAMNGTISVESKLNIGTVFKVEIPFLKVNSVKKNKEKINITKSLTGKRILVADDDMLNQTIVAHILNKENVKLTLVKDGLEALNALKTKIFDLVLLDIHMPNITGEQLVQQKNDFNKANINIPFLALTANTTPEDIKRYHKIGFAAIISKPYTANDFLERISLNLS